MTVARGNESLLVYAFPEVRKAVARAREALIAAEVALASAEAYLVALTGQVSREEE